MCHGGINISAVIWYIVLESSYYGICDQLEQLAVAFLSLKTMGPIMSKQTYYKSTT